MAQAPGELPIPPHAGGRSPFKVGKHVQHAKLGWCAKLANGVLMPLVGLGTWQAPPDEAAQAVEWAWKAGYHLVDTAQIYRNEGAIGERLEKVGANRGALCFGNITWLFSLRRVDAVVGLLMLLLRVVPLLLCK